MTPDNDPALDSTHDPAGRARLVALLEPLGVAYELFACDPGLADTAAFCAAYGFAPEESANTILVIGKGDPPRYAACVVLAPNRLDVNRTVRDRLGTRKASFAPAESTREITGMEIVPRDLAENLVLMLSPFAPHIAEEIWAHLGHTKTLARRPWPQYDPEKLVESTMELPVQVNGKLRDKITVAADASETDILETAARAPKVVPWLDGKTILKKLYVPKRLVNFVVG